MASILRVAFIGAGTVAGLHAGAVHATSGVEFAGVYDPQVDAANRFVQQHGGQTYSSLDALLGDPTVQAVAVLSPLRKAIGPGSRTDSRHPAGSVSRQADLHACT
jgi:predicted dehydrogenase